MLAKSAGQLFVLNYVRTAELSLRRVLVLLSLALFAAGAAWLVDECESQAQRIAAVMKAKRAGIVYGPVELTMDAPAGTAEAAPPHEERHHALSDFIARRYNVSRDVTLDLVQMAHAAGHQVGLDPLLIIAVMAVESRFNPLAESVAGAKGLMQVIPRYHLAKLREFGGEKWSVFDPETNILVGSQILKEYWRRTGSLNQALQLYVGSPDDEFDRYTGRVMNEKQRLQQFLRKIGQRHG